MMKQAFPRGRESECCSKERVADTLDLGRGLVFRRVALVFHALLFLSFAGCLRIEGTIFPHGGADLGLDYQLRHGTLETERLKFVSPNIEIVAAEVRPRPGPERGRLGGRGRSAYFHLRAHDLGALSDAYMFRFVTVTKLQKPRGNVSGLMIKIRNDKDPRRDLKGLRFFLSLVPHQEPVVIRLTFPGRVISSDADSIDRDSATWRFSSAAFFGNPEVTMTAWYGNPPKRALDREGSDGTNLGSRQGRAS
jgi:hypothetical protein